LPVASFELRGEALRLLKRAGIQLECQFVNLNPADNGAWWRVGKEAKPRIRSDRIGADAETLPQGFAHIPASVDVEVRPGYERPADAFGVVRPDGAGLGNPRRAKQEPVADMVFSFDIALGAGFSALQSRASLA
jgi:hypothetical protein